MSIAIIMPVAIEVVGDRTKSSGRNDPFIISDVDEDTWYSSF
jgi:hypothetical protein